MFSDNVSKTYNFQDASQEIIIMLLGAFLLGSLLTWLLSKFFSGDYSVENNAYRYENQKNSESNLLRQNTNLQASTTSDVRIVERPTLQKAKIVTAPDDLTKISGIDHKLQSELKTYNITTYADLRDISNADLKAIQGKQQTHKREVETWPHQASLAAKGEWEKLTNYQGFIQRVQNASETSEVSIAKQNKQSKDELTKLVGINPEIEKCLNIQDIHSFKQLSQVDSETLKSHVANINSDIKDHEIESWPHQAAMAEKQQWDELQVYQDFMHSAEPEIADHHIDSAEQKPQKSNDNLDHLSDDIQLDGDETNLSDHDDLKKIEGIGPKIEEVLNNGGIYTYSQMQNSNNKRLQSLLDDAGPQFRVHDPKTWPHQAGMANRSEWNELATYQEKLLEEQAEKAKKNYETNKSSSEKKVRKLKAVSKTDDLKKIEGIGPKIEDVLNNAGITTFKALSKKPSSKIKKLLDDAGPQFRMHDPLTWPQQAQMADDSAWEDLKKYQKSLLQKQAIKAQRKQASEKKKSTQSKTNKKVSRLTAISKKDDLRKIEGIGPKIQELLNNAGITTFKALSKKSRDAIKKLLMEAGPQFRMHEPESWPQQAKLASKGDWDALKEYQEFLRNGPK